MGLPLLKEAFEPIGEAAALPVKTPANDVSSWRSRIVLDARRMEEADLTFRATSRRQMSKLEAAARDYADAGADIGDIISDLEGFRREICAGIEDLVLFIRHFDEECKKLGRTISQHSAEDGHFFRRQVRKARGYLESFLEARQKNAGLLTVLLAELDPAARGGPTFERPQDLIAHLRRLRG